MPGKTWKHVCRKGRGWVWTGVEVCPACGAVGAYDGWSYGMWEAMGRYQRRYGLKPIGPHRHLADRLFENASFACPMCEGRGLVDVDGGADYAECGVCEGGGQLIRLSAEEFDARRQQVLAIYPDAAAKW